MVPQTIFPLWFSRSMDVFLRTSKNMGNLEQPWDISVIKNFEDSAKNFPFISHLSVDCPCFVIYTFLGGISHFPEQVVNFLGEETRQCTIWYLLQYLVKCYANNLNINMFLIIYIDLMWKQYCNINRKDTIFIWPMRNFRRTEVEEFI